MISQFEKTQTWLYILLTKSLKYSFFDVILSVAKNLISLNSIRWILHFVQNDNPTKVSLIAIIIILIGCCAAISAPDSDNLLRINTIAEYYSQAPTLVSPKNHVGNVALKPAFVWNSTEDNRYILQISQLEDFSDTETIIISNISDTSYTLTSALKSSTKYFWHVATLTEGSGPLWSTTWSFITIQDPPTKPELVAPAKGTFEVPTAPQFIWKPAERVDYYDLYICPNPDFKNEVLTERIDTGTSFKPDYSIDYDRIYYWFVSAVGSGQGVDSDVWWFSTGPVGVQDETSRSSHYDDIVLYPNPSEGTITIKASTSVANIKRIDFFTGIGILIISESPVGLLQEKIGIQINLSRLPCGLYYIQILLNDGSYVRKNLILTK